MSEEEIIKECTELAKDEYKQLYDCWDIERAEQAIQGLLDLYNKEKEKNEDLQIKVRYYEDIMIKQNVEREFETLYKDLHRIVKTEYVSKDKIKDLIQDIDETIHITKDDEVKFYMLGFKNSINKLLEERN